MMIVPENPNDVINNYAFIEPQKPKWKLSPAPDLEFHLPDAPNWFWRKMQYLILGFKWESLEKDDE